MSVSPEIPPDLEPDAAAPGLEVPSDFFRGNVRAGLEAMRLRLLDLTGNNRLLNYRHTRNGSLQFVGASLDGITSHLLAGRESLIVPVPVPDRTVEEAEHETAARETAGRIALPGRPAAPRRRVRPPVLEAATLAGLPTSLDLDAEPSEDVPARLQTLLYPEDLEAILRKLASAARTAIEETGANMLHLVLGSLEYYESEDSDKPRFAPLLLLPVAFRKGTPDSQTGADRYYLEAAGGGAGLSANFSLQELLRRDFATTLPDLEAGDDGDGELPEGYLRRVASIITAKGRWRLRRQLYLALLSFGKLLMYRDLDPNSKEWPAGQNPVDHPLVRDFFEGRPREGEPEHAREYELDNPALAPRVPDLISDADSSQHSALVDALDGRNLVIEGPPGTGKSQTITNLIAAALVRGKSVLFVAEKLAALEVVRSRLNDAGLGAFCLELHSHKTQKRALLDDVDRRLRMGTFAEPANYDEKLALLHDQRRRLNDYAVLLQTSFGVRGLSAHKILGAAQRWRVVLGPETCALLQNVSLPLVEQMDGVRYEERRNALESFGSHLAEVQSQGGGKLADHPWHGIGNAALAYHEHEALLGHLRTAVGGADSLASFGADLTLRFRLVRPESLAACAALADAVQALPAPGDAQVERIFPLLVPHLSTPIALARFTAFAERLREWEHLRDQVRGILVVDLDLPVERLRALREVRAGLGRLCLEAKTTAEALAAADDFARLGERVAGVLITLEELRKRLGKSLGNESVPIRPTVADLAPVATALGLAESAPQEVLHLRQLLPDAEAATPFLREARAEAEPLLVFREDLGARFRLQGLPPAPELARLAAVAANAGILRFLSGEFRAAKRDYLGLRRSPGAFSKESMQTDLHALADLRERLERFEAKPVYRTTLGGLFDGADTPFADLERLLTWLENVRRQLPGDAESTGFRLAQAVRSASPATLANVAALRATLGDVAELGRILEACRRERWPVGRDWPLDLPGIADALVALGAEIQTASGELTAAGVHPNQDFDGLEVALEAAGRLRLTESGLANDEAAAHTLGDDFAGADTDAGRIERTLALVNAVRAAPLGGETQNWLLGGEVAARLTDLHAAGQNLAEATEEHESQVTAFEGHGKPFWGLWFGSEAANGADGLKEVPFSTFTARAFHALRNEAALPSWIAYLRTRQQCVDLKLIPLVERAEAGHYPAVRTPDAFAFVYHESLARRLLLAHPALEQFSGLTHEGVRARFAASDREVMHLYRQRAARVIAGLRSVPAGIVGGRVRDLSQKGLLRHEISKQTRHIPIRKLLDRAGEALRALKPCFMMGPLSVAQYLKPGAPPFDLIVMDEASQLRPEDALGAVARGGQLVVVGDPKQLPPTDFFKRSIGSEEDDEEEAEETAAAAGTESILDLASSLYQPLRRLRWHYRSRHESLIAFSNQEFYDGDLIVFPSPAAASRDGLGVRFEHVPEGVLKDRRNPREAERVVAAALAHMREHPGESLGIAALNVPQRELIENLFEAARKNEPAAERFVEARAESLEPFFIKNLENVQGDERDVIFVSVTYGPPTTGVPVPQRFGPINGPSGHRRLNVLFTRAKRRLVVFSSLTADDVRVGPGSSRGVRAFKGYLAFAQTGRLVGQAALSARGPDSDFEVAVAAALRARNLDVVHQVGVAGYFIDLAVRDPNKTDAFLLGVECDGATYHSGRCARDRDRLRQQVLEGLGWNIHRVWSTDWFKYPAQEVAKVVARVEALLARERSAAVKLPVAASLPGARGIAPEIPASESTSTGVSPRLNPNPGQMKLDLVDRSSSLRSRPEVNPSTTKLSAEEARQQLVTFRGNVLRTAFPESDPAQGLLRKTLLDALLKERPRDLRDWLLTIPKHLREETEQAQVKRFLPEVLAILARVEP